MSTQPVVNTTATMNVSAITLDVLEQFVVATRDWPRDTVVGITQSSHRNESNTCISATLRGAS
ncbi:MAG: hypothetical protein U5O16_40965 [Rhodococcus sp. (in: high G+C Gram-positive bacteria)]|uniref:hypothetical protein n=1 Tax=Rhodococcus sp. TaxID=1831 RepID=UPI002AD9FFEE|nr:hypothetical protein [Rhodococcus sp. (in: high G+C Gram-positive bacteria)]